MPISSRIEPAYIPPEKWLRSQDPPLGVQEGHAFGVDCVIIRYSTDTVGDGPNLHVHPYDEVFHILEGRAEFTVGDRTFEAIAGSLIVGPANVPHAYKNLGPGRLDSLDVHLNREWPPSCFDATSTLVLRKKTTVVRRLDHFARWVFCSCLPEHLMLGMHFDAVAPIAIVASLRSEVARDPTKMGAIADILHFTTLESFTR